MQQSVKYIFEKTSRNKNIIYLCKKKTKREQIAKKLYFIKETREKWQFLFYLYIFFSHFLPSSFFSISWILNYIKWVKCLALMNFHRLNIKHCKSLDASQNCRLTDYIFPSFPNWDSPGLRSQNIDLTKSLKVFKNYHTFIYIRIYTYTKSTK